LSTIISKISEISIKQKPENENVMEGLLSTSLSVSSGELSSLPETSGSLLTLSVSSGDLSSLLQTEGSYVGTVRADEDTLSVSSGEMSSLPPTDDEGEDFQNDAINEDEAGTDEDEGLTTLSDCDTVYKTFQYAVREFPSNNCVGSLSSTSPPAISFTSYADTAALINTVATAFHDLSLVEPNEEGLKLFGIFSKNSPDWIVAEQAAYSNGAAVVPLYSTLGASALDYILSQTNLQTVLCDSPASAQTLIDLKNSNPSLALKTVIISSPSSPLPSAPSGLNLLPFSSLKSHKSQYVFNPTPPTANDLATICYTSGTTGNPKGVLLTHRNFVSIAANALSLISLSSTDVHFSYLPLAHIFERTMQVGLYHVGASVVFSSGNVKTLTEELKVATPTIFIAVPRVLSKFQDGIMAKVSQADAMKQTVFKTAVDQKIANLASNTLEHPQWDAMVFARVKANLGLGNVR
jgi:long-chain acyl-CoA synthetase